MTTRNPAKLIPADFVDTPSADWLDALVVRAVESPELSGGSVAWLLTAGAAAPTASGVSAEEVSALGFEGKVGETATFARTDGPNIILVGLGAAAELTTAILRDVAANAARA
ncbi:MAG TPA: M17 family peptidase N-terminal domain-containing protein, partial [Microbacteriaceae bacterium]|nr:M17 family peptidase N-terminal domain-containing protein [Microbacteriaceae bacterium]